MAYMMKRLTPEMERMASGGTFKEISKSAISTLTIPLPPLEVQHQIVAEIEGYQKIIDGARQVLDNYKPHIAISPDWPVVPLEDACNIQRGKFSHRPRNEPRFYGGQYPFIQTLPIRFVANEAFRC